MANHITATYRSLFLRIAGSALLIATGAIHLDLYLTGYRYVTTIGPLFLLQVIVAFLLALAVLALPRRLVALAAAFFPLTTLGGYILSLWISLFGFHEVRTTAGIVAGVIEIAAFATLGAWALWFAPEANEPLPLANLLHRSNQLPADRTASGEPSVSLARRALAPLAGLALLALLLAAIIG